MNNMNSHVDILGILFIILGVLGMVVGIGVFMIIFGAGALSGDHQAALITGTVGFVVACIVIVLSAPSIIVGIGLRRRREWARIFAIIISVLHVFSFPLGTAVAVYAFWVLFHQETVQIFAAQGALTTSSL